MDQNVRYDGLILKVVVCVQLLLTTWAQLTIPTVGIFLSNTYFYQNLLLILFGALSIAKAKSADTALMYLLVNVISVLNDIIFLSMYQPIAAAAIEDHKQVLPRLTIDTYRFSLGMSILNLILKPVVCYVLFKVYQSRGGNFSAELASVTAGGRERYQGYDQIDDNSTSTVETASPHSRLAA